MNEPLVSVICLCYNHERFVKEAIRSVSGQTYPNVQLVVVDDHSTDQSVESISKTLSGYPSAEFIPLSTNQGNCRAFNKGLARAKGDFIIDLSADDVLMADRIEKGINVFQSAGEQVGVNFSDAQLIDDKGEILGYHSDRFPHLSVPQGNIYIDVLERYFINGPTMMMRRKVLEALSGYDEALAYEDFDFWVRSSRKFDYCYTPEALVKRRILSGSLGQKQYLKGTLQLRSTLRVCAKAMALNRTSEEHSSLKKRIYYEMRQAFRLGEMSIVWDYLNLFRRIPR